MTMTWRKCIHSRRDIVDHYFDMTEIASNTATSEITLYVNGARKVVDSITQYNTQTTLLQVNFTSSICISMNNSKFF